MCASADIQAYCKGFQGSTLINELGTWEAVDTVISNHVECFPCELIERADGLVQSIIVTFLEGASTSKTLLSHVNNVP